MDDRKETEKLIKDMTWFYFYYYLHLIIMLFVGNNIKSKANVI